MCSIAVKLSEAGGSFEPIGTFFVRPFTFSYALAYAGKDVFAPVVKEVNGWVTHGFLHVSGVGGGECSPDACTTLFSLVSIPLRQCRSGYSAISSHDERLLGQYCPNKLPVVGTGRRP